MTQSSLLLQKQLKGLIIYYWCQVKNKIKSVFNYYLELIKNPLDGFSAGLIDDNDIYKWEVLIIGPPETI